MERKSLVTPPPANAEARFGAWSPFDNLPKGRGGLRSRVPNLSKRRAPDTIPDEVGQVAFRGQGEGIQNHVDPLFLKPVPQSRTRQISSVELATVGERGLEVDWRQCVRKTAEEQTVHVLVKRERELAQSFNESERASLPGVGRLQDERDVRSAGLLKLLDALEQPVGNRLAVCDEQKAQTCACVVTHVCGCPGGLWATHCAQE